MSAMKMGADQPAPAPRLSLTLGHTYSDRVAALFDHSIAPKGLELTLVEAPASELFSRMLHDREFDVAEMSLASYVISRSRGDDEFIALPVFPSRMFRHSAIYVRTDSDIDSPVALASGRIGMPEYQMTACVWVRDVLRNDYGLDLAGIEWRTGGLDEPGGDERIELQVPPGLHIERIGHHETLSTLLEEGLLDAIVSPRAPIAFQEGSMRRLFRDSKAVEIDYFQRTGIFPIMHTLVIKRALYDAQPWTARALIEAFEASKTRAWARLDETDYLTYGLVWMVDAALEQKGIFGPEHWPYGIQENRFVLQQFLRACREQGLVAIDLDLAQLFVQYGSPGLPESG